MCTRVPKSVMTMALRIDICALPAAGFCPGSRSSLVARRNSKPCGGEGLYFHAFISYMDFYIEINRLCQDWRNTADLLVLWGVKDACRTMSMCYISGIPSAHALLLFEVRECQTPMPACCAPTGSGKVAWRISPGSSSSCFSRSTTEGRKRRGGIRTPTTQDTRNSFPTPSGRTRWTSRSGSEGATDARSGCDTFG